MNPIYKELNSLIESISHNELKRNPKIKDKIKELIDKIEVEVKKEEITIASKSLINRYLNKKMLKG